MEMAKEYLSVIKNEKLPLIVSPQRAFGPTMSAYFDFSNSRASCQPRCPRLISGDEQK